MPRGPFNTTAEFFHGPAGISPGTSRGEAEVRFVDANGIFATGNGHPEIVGWITIAEYEPRGSWTAPLAGFKPSLGDDVLLGDESEPSMWVAFVEHIDWEDKPDYFRASVCLLPRPAECSCAGSSNDSCAEAIELDLDVPGDGSIDEAPWQAWYKITLPAGTYHVSWTWEGDGVEVNALTGTCEDLTNIGESSGACTEFIVPEEYEGDVYINVNSPDESPVTFTLTVGEGEC